MTFDDWVKEIDDKGIPRYQKLYDSWVKEDTNDILAWQRYYWSLRKAFEAGQNDKN
jgi:hypothetical protein